MPTTALSDRFRFPPSAATIPATLPPRPAVQLPLAGGVPVLGNRAFMRAWAARRSRVAPGAGLPRR